MFVQLVQNDSLQMLVVLLRRVTGIISYLRLIVFVLVIANDDLVKVGTGFPERNHRSSLSSLLQHLIQCYNISEGSIVGDLICLNRRVLFSSDSTE